MIQRCITWKLRDGGTTESIVKIAKKVLKSIVKSKACFNFFMFFITLILTKNKNINHPYWYLSTILVIRPSTDGVERAVKIKTANREYIRPAGKLHLIPDLQCYIEHIELIVRDMKWHDRRDSISIFDGNYSQNCWTQSVAASFFNFLCYELFFELVVLLYVDLYVSTA